MKNLKKVFEKTLSLITVAALIFFVPFTPYAFAASLTSVKDTMSTQAKNTAADHTLSWTLASGHTTAVNATIAIDFVVADFIPTGTWATNDFAFTDDVRSAAAPASVGQTGSLTTCSGSSATNYIVNVDTTNATFTITTCTGWTTSSATQATTFVIKGATGGAGTLTNANTDTNSSVFTITDGVNDTDSGTGALVIETNDVVTVTATVNPTLTFALGSNTVALGTLDSATAKTGSHTMTISTNAVSGAAITVSGVTLTSGANTITACSSGCTTNPGNAEQFGINLKDNATPDVGAEVSGSAPIAAAAAGYATADNFRFVTGETVASAANAINTSTFTVSYLANITPLTEAGSYTTSLTYIATGTF